MIEAQLRANSAALQRAYDRMPYSVQNLLTSARGWFLTRNRYAPRMFSLLRELRSHERWTVEEINAFQLQALRKIIKHARTTSPFYADYPECNIRSFADLRRFPVLTRELVRENGDRIASRAVQSAERIRVGTTGTTGASLQVTYSEPVARRHCVRPASPSLAAALFLRSAPSRPFGLTIFSNARRWPASFICLNRTLRTTWNFCVRTPAKFSRAFLQFSPFLPTSFSKPAKQSRCAPFLRTASRCIRFYGKTSRKHSPHAPTISTATPNTPG
jgi:hypothetical protein